MSSKVLCVLTDGFEEGEALMPVALLRRGGVRVDIAALSAHEATGGHDISINHIYDIDDVDVTGYDVLMLPGGPHWPLIEKDERVRAAIRFFMDHDRLVGAICAAPTILGRMGYLKGRKYTCFTSMNENFGGEYIDQYVVTDGRLITARSVAASIDFGLALLEAAAGSERAAGVKERIYY